MAEVAGLILEGIAVASLYTTARDAFEFFELKDGYSRDYEIATTKILVLRRRLQIWAETTRIERPGDEAEELRERWLGEGDAVTRSLLGIDTILNSVKFLSQNHGLDHQRGSHTGYLSGRSSPQKQGFTQKCGPRKRSWHKQQHFLRKKFIWAIYDKKKLDGLIFELDFLITNLEKVSQGLSISDQKLRIKSTKSPFEHIPGIQKFLAMSQTETVFQGPGHKFGDPAASGDSQSGAAHSQTSAPMRSNLDGTDGSQPISTANSTTDAATNTPEGQNRNSNPTVNTNRLENNLSTSGSHIIVSNFHGPPANNTAVGNRAYGTSTQFAGNGNNDTLRELMRNNGASDQKNA